MLADNAVAIASCKMVLSQQLFSTFPLVVESNWMKIYDVLVIGAGPVGLATAIGLRKRGIDNILVIDQTRAFRQIGQGVDLLPIY